MTVILFPGGQAWVWTHAALILRFQWDGVIQTEMVRGERAVTDRLLTLPQGPRLL